MSTVLQEKATVASQPKMLDAEEVTSITTSFIKRIGNKGTLKPKKVSFENGVYLVEIEMKRLMASVKVDAETREIKEYEVQPKAEETPASFISPKLLLMVLGMSAGTYVALNFTFKMLGI